MTEKQAKKEALTLLGQWAAVRRIKSDFAPVRFQIGVVSIDETKNKKHVFVGLGFGDSWEDALNMVRVRKEAGIDEPSDSGG